MLSEVIRNFEAWALEQKLIERTMESGRQNLQSYAVENAEDAARWGKPNTDPNLVEGHPLEDFVLKLENQSLNIRHAIPTLYEHHPSKPHFYIDTQLGIYLPDPNSDGEAKYLCVGYYRLIFTPEGEIEDDYLVFEDDFFENGNEPI